ncbi:MAG: hypothetical protein COT74_04460 [Bdellovibrionales bacterium CG10_big_fil_rev_8_21_14_0_10_45_34]|nr:MAG: hypothetical protein COT74_04460 [Bdellovibrionales bacterium CG10_big_fil_rev_8_21_14_0_10_45_34]
MGRNQKNQILKEDLSENSAEVLLQSPGQFFHESVRDALAARSMETFPLAESYLADILEKYMVTDALYELDNESGKRRQDTLAEMFLRAQNAETSLKLNLLKRLAETSLYVGGFFGESLDRKIVDIDYYAEMGGSAYQMLSRLVAEDTFAHLYKEYSYRFLEFVDVLSHISLKSRPNSNKNLLHHYTRYLKTGSEQALETLLEQGVIPPAGPTKITEN